MTALDLAPPRSRGERGAATAVVVGSGVAGLSAALALAGGAVRVVVVSSGPVGDSGSSPLAQGGVAAAVAPTDSAADHALDTVAVSAGLADRAAVDAVVGGGRQAIEALVALGTRFDRAADGALALGREAGHSARRIVHADGDATGAEVMATLRRAVAARSDVEIREWTDAVELVVERSGRRVRGVVLAGADGGREVVMADAVIIATGGYAHCFERTTTPPEVIGSGIAMAARAGAAIADMEFVQFHPTALDLTRSGSSPDRGARLPLLTEALRGEGAVLIDADGRRFMADVHPDAELAPRDVVARAGYRSLRQGRGAYLDATAAVGDAFPLRFPTVHRLATAAGFDPRTEPLPVTPAAHYCMGGIAVDVRGRTSLAGLWAVGEASSSGLHGANRLASNSLLEGLVMGTRAAADVTAVLAAGVPPSSDGLWVPASGSPASGVIPHDESVVAELRRILWAHAGVERDDAGLRAGLAAVDALGLGEFPVAGRVADVATVARLVLRAALARTESRGAHHRLDHPDTDAAQAVRRVSNRWLIPAPLVALGSSPVGLVAVGSSPSSW